jgi:hypothetical protein
MLPSRVPFVLHHLRWQRVGSAYRTGKKESNVRLPPDSGQISGPSHIFIQDDELMFKPEFSLLRVDVQAGFSSTLRTQDGQVEGSKAELRPLSQGHYARYSRLFTRQRLSVSF